MTKTFSLADLDATKASEQAFEFEYINAATGEGTGIFLSVLGGESEAVTAEVAKLINERRRKQAAREVQRKIGVGTKPTEFETLESDVAFGQRLAAVRLVGWRGISDPWTAENALKLCTSNRDIASQVTQQSDMVGNFMKL
ncbi:MAG: hypothetical protein COX55_09040 [Zetaproteobacteria bacterium CG23_combo_of_CG06-09_8_20_14_all_54_7]|nr:MAG: hypothetical protein COX55_09040 [Zetaproteobacteria bacterium CG23_combo_of_CG06-09_8_20_14_all_54_7]